MLMSSKGRFLARGPFPADHGGNRGGSHGRGRHAAGGRQAFFRGSQAGDSHGGEGRPEGHSARGGRGGRGHGGGRGGDGHGRGGGRHGRYFGHGDLKLVLLALIAEKPRHGYDLIRSIADSTGGIYRPSPGVIYPTLALLEDLGHVRAIEDVEQRRLLEITAEGRAYLDAHRVSLAEVQSQIPGRRSPQVEAQVGEVRGAMERLRQALRTTLSSGPVDAARLAKIVATIEQAARAVSAHDPSAGDAPGGDAS